jgi:uncharacterized membrane protein YtjA (UPF0391 family)
MHNAPPVVFPVGRFVWGVRWACVLAFLTVSVLAGWLGFTDASAAICAWTLFVWSCAAVGAVWWAPREFLQQGDLVWDGEVWHGPGQLSEGAPLQLSLTLDGGFFMLVSLHAQPGALAFRRHALLRQSDMPSRWHGFRCAVYSRRTAVARQT